MTADNEWPERLFQEAYTQYLYPALSMSLVRQKQTKIFCNKDICLFLRIRRNSVHLGTHPAHFMACTKTAVLHSMGYIVHWYWLPKLQAASQHVRTQFSPVGLRSNFCVPFIRIFTGGASWLKHVGEDEFCMHMNLKMMRGYKWFQPTL